MYLSGNFILFQFLPEPLHSNVSSKVTWGGAKGWSISGKKKWTVIKREENQMWKQGATKQKELSQIKNYGLKLIAIYRMKYLWNGDIPHETKNDII